MAARFLTFCSSTVTWWVMWGHKEPSSQEEITPGILFSFFCFHLTCLTSKMFSTRTQSATGGPAGVSNGVHNMCWKWTVTQRTSLHQTSTDDIIFRDYDRWWSYFSFSAETSSSWWCQSRLQFRAHSVLWLFDSKLKTQEHEEKQKKVHFPSVFLVSGLIVLSWFGFYSLSSVVRWESRRTQHSTAATFKYEAGLTIISSQTEQPRNAIH